MVRRLTLALAAVYVVLGALEVVLKVRDDAAVATIAFFGGTLLGGAGLILLGLHGHVSRATGRALVMFGAALGFLASAWTLLVPVLAVTVLVAHGRQPVGAAAGSPPAR